MAVSASVANSVIAGLITRDAPARTNRAAKRARLQISVRQPISKLRQHVVRPFHPRLCQRKPIRAGENAVQIKIIGQRRAGGQFIG